ncbi:hypothetical protein [Pandoraea sputorum]|uniref:Secretion system X translation initiation factor n=1 Tax=Pandoraea sputorum TaxID=93222 RepID=A0A239SEC7_9BURK|nr:hypothetical protein [Pandoraea sputorum]APD12365.1 hypothetical protein NA29_25375 [Pandoraea sputorum]SNU83815.1 Uncharacterised protein [Pandoraea sputorum]VVD94910.1 hypothetical protein PSP20601_01819 [Pandoraea sputorum]
MTPRRLLLWGSLAASIAAALADPSFLPFFPSSASTPPVAAPVTHAHRSRASTASQTMATLASPASARTTGGSDERDKRDESDDSLAAERRELLRQVRAFVSGSGPSVGASSIVAPVPREMLADADGAPAPQRLFVSQNWGPPPPAPSSAPVPATPLPPTAPPLPFTYLGKALAAGAWEVYLARGEKTFIVHENSVVDDVYRVASIKPPRLSLIYIPMNQQQELDIGGTQ